MAYSLNTNISDDKAKEMAATVSREQFERYMNDFVPYENELIGSLGELENPGRAGRQATADAQRARASLERMRERYGTSLNASQQSAENRMTRLDTTLSSLGARNDNRVASEDRDYALKGQLLNLGNGVRSSAQSSLTGVAANAQARENSYEQAKAQHSAQESQQRASTVASLAAIAAIAFM